MTDTAKELAEVLAAQAKISDNVAKAKKKLAELQERISAGEGTGDPIKDFVIVQAGINAALEKKARALDRKLNDGVGKPILIVDKACRWRRYKSESTQYDGLVFQRLGIPTENPVWSLHGLTLPMQHHVWAIATGPEFELDVEEYDYGNEMETPQWHVKKTPIRFRASDINDGNLLQTLLRLDLGSKQEDLPPELEKAASDFYHTEIHSRNGVKHADRHIYIGRGIAQYFKKHLRSDTSKNVYEDALFCLERAMTREAYAQSERRTLIKKREELWSTLERITELPEDQRLAVVRSAVQLGMHKMSETKPGSVRGVEYDISEYVLGLCEQYKIPVPQAKK